MGTFSKDDNPLWRALEDGTRPRQQTLADLIAPARSGAGLLPPAPALGSILGVPQAKKRRVFFSFHYADIMRVNNVRLSGEFAKAPSASGREVEGFYDNSLWESRKRDGDEAIRNLIREGVKNSSAVCVLVGTETWSRPWVRYEIARALIDGRGLLVVHVNGLRHHQLMIPHAPGLNPLEYIGLYNQPQHGILSAPKYQLYEKKAVWKGYGYSFEWHPYEKHTHSVDRPQWLPDPSPGYIMPLSTGVAVRDYVSEDGFRNIGAWIDAAAIAAGR